MKTLALAFFIVLAAACIAFYSLGFFGVTASVAGPISSTLFGLITYVAQTIDKGKSGKGLSLLPKGVVEYQDFAMSRMRMLLFSTLIAISLQELSNALPFIGAGFAGVSLNSLSPIAAAVDLPLNCAIMFFLAKWIGTRSYKTPFLITIVFCLLSELGTHGLDYAMVPGDDFQSIFHAPKDAGTFLLGIAVGVAIVLIPALAGCWYGARQRMSRYLSYLLKRIPRDTGVTLINIAYEEASKIAGERGLVTAG